MKSTIISIFIAAGIIVGAILISNASPGSGNGAAAHNVSIVDGKQIIEIRAKGGYQPRKSVAEAGIPTILRFDTSGTFDCSASVRIPVLGISKILPQTGSTDIDLGIAKAGTFQGTCGMGMYPFEIEFRS